ncbi:MAG: exodeoxyribonuclease VII large subunit [Parachlamydiales bacterium]|jgi:exodeoxyribonuclease VII large subunit
MANTLDVSSALTVSALSAAIKNNLEGAFSQVVLQGEVSNCKLQQSGHWYLTLKDSQAQIAAVMFRGEASSLSFEPKNGDKVLIEGSLNVYPAGGRYQIVIRKMQKEGLGDLLLKLEALKKKVHQLGWFRKEHKKKLPFLPHTIGIITSPTGAAIQDILNILNRRGANFHVILNPVKVQGDGAAEEIARAIRFFNDKLPVDVMIVGRGGGSFEDLWCFNEEIVAEAIFLSRIPIICAVGHETDHTIAEYVADVRAPTPSACAEIVMAEQLELQKHLDQLKRQCCQALLHHLRKHKQELSGILRHPLFMTPYYLLGRWMQKIDDIRQQSDRLLPTKMNQWKVKLSHAAKLLQSLDPRKKLQQRRQQLLSWQQALDRAAQTTLTLQAQKLQGLSQTLQALDPRVLLSKGFSVLFNEKDGSLITDASQMKPGDKFNARLAKGTLEATIDKITP